MIVNIYLKMIVNIQKHGTNQYIFETLDKNCTSGSWKIWFTAVGPFSPVSGADRGGPGEGDERSDGALQRGAHLENVAND